MRTPGFKPLSQSSPLVATVLGTALGLLSFALSAWLFRTGAVHAATMAAESALLVALVCTAALALIDGPAHMRRARVPIGRVMPPSWWPRDAESMPLLAACVGGPMIVGAGAAVLLFR